MKPFRIAGLAACVCAIAWGQQRLDPVQWSMTANTEVAQPGATIPLRLTAKIEPGWHLYSATIPKDLLPTTIKVIDNPAIESYTVYQPQGARAMDLNFKVEVETFSTQADFWIPVTLKKDASGPIELTAQIRYRVCDDKQCLNPKTKTAAFKLTAAPFAPALAAFTVPPGYIEIKPGAARVSAPPPPTAEKDPAPSQGLLGFALAAFGFGLAAVFTPCVFPMIPITVTFFLSKRGGIIQALVFSLGIVVLFCALGLGVTALAGPIGISQLGGNPWVNAFISVVFGIFALSLLGAFEITLPSSLLTSLDRASRRGGYAGTLLMGLTFSLTSFACVGPFVGPLLASSVQAQGAAQPVVGMAAFASGLASPFFFLAAFPSYLKKLPRSGGWLARVKVVMGFILLAGTLKYLSNIDQVLQTGFLTRERFLAAWFVLFSMAGLYLLGLLRLEGIEADDKLGIGRLLCASGLLIFAFSLLPGMFGAPLGELDAYVPAATGGISGSNTAADGLQWMKNDYRAALDRGRQENKLVLVTFTGYACTNCHWMKANMFPRPEIAEIAKDLVLVELYTDGADTASEDNARLEDTKFASVSTPYYALLDANEKVLATSGYTRNVQEFLAFLKTRSKA